jgi:hypothetical protein
MVVLLLGAMAAGVVVWRERRMTRTKAEAAEVATVKTAAELLARESETLKTRIAKVESALRIDGARIQAEAARGNLPAFMK